MLLSVQKPRIKEAKKSLRSKSQVDAALDIADKNREMIHKIKDYVSQN